MASNPPGECCTQGNTHAHEASPKGEIKVFGGVETYFSYPPNAQESGTKKVIIFLPDIIGIKVTTSQTWADKFAAHGYFVVMPDIYNGDPALPPEKRTGGFNLQEWIDAHGVDKIDPILDLVYTEIVKEFKPEKIGTVGICYGAKYSVRLLKNRADAGFLAHPSFVSFEELAEIKGPVSIAAAETDSIFTKDLRRQTEDLLSELKVLYQLFLYSNTLHGFTTRGDPKSRVVQFQSESAFVQAIRWFREYL